MPVGFFFVRAQRPESLAVMRTVSADFDERLNMNICSELIVLVVVYCAGNRGAVVGGRASARSHVPA